MLLPYGEYFNDYVNMDLGVFEGVEFNEMVNKGRRVCRFCAGGVGLWKSDMPGSLAIGRRRRATAVAGETESGGERGGGRTAGLCEAFEGGPVDVEAGYGVALLDEVGGHAEAHGSEAAEADCGFGSHREVVTSWLVQECRAASLCLWTSASRETITMF